MNGCGAVHPVPQAHRYGTSIGHEDGAIGAFPSELTVRPSLFDACLDIRGWRDSEDHLPAFVPYLDRLSGQLHEQVRVNVKATLDGMLPCSFHGVLNLPSAMGIVVHGA